MWLMEQIMWKSFDKRLAAFLVEESNIEGTNLLKVTHEKIANHMGTAREVVTRMLRYFQGEGLVKLTRGAIEITDHDGLEALQEA
jgi:CRP/FNR family transcriptional regulator